MKNEKNQMIKSGGLNRPKKRGDEVDMSDFKIEDKHVQQID